VIHSSTDMRKRPSMMAINLEHQYVSLLGRDA
jgi:hypothetical protein